MSAIEASLKLEISQYQQALAKATGEVRKFRQQASSEAKGLSGDLFGIGEAVQGMLPAVGAASLITGIRGLMTSYDDLVDSALRLGETTETLQRVEYASKLMASVDAEGLVNSFLKLEKALGEIENKKATAALENLGITSEKLARMPLDEKVLAMSEAFQQSRASGTGYNDILGLLGKSAGDLIPLFEQSGVAIREAFNEAPVVMDSTVQSMAAMNDKLDGFLLRVKAGAGGIVALGEGLAGMLGGKSWVDAFASPDGGPELDAQKKRDQQAAAREDARIIADTEKAQTDAAKEAEKLGKEKERQDKAIQSLQDGIRDVEISRLEPAERLVRLGEIQRQKIDQLRNAGGQFYEATVAGMEKFAAAQVKNGSTSAEETLKKYLEIQRIQQQMEGLSGGLRDSAATGAEDNLRAEAAQFELFLEEMISDELEYQNQLKAEKSLAEEIALLQAKANGQTQLVEAMERELSIREKTAEIMSRAGMGEAEARNAAAKIEALKGQAAGRDKGATSTAAKEEAKDKILGFSRARQGGAYERQDHLYDDPRQKRNPANTPEMLGPKAERNAQQQGPQQSTDTTAQLGQQALNLMQQMLAALA